MTEFKTLVVSALQGLSKPEQVRTQYYQSRYQALLKFKDVIQAILAEPLFLDDFHRVEPEVYCNFLVHSAETLICKNGSEVVGVGCFSEVVPSRSATFFGWITPAARAGFGGQKMMRSFLHEDVLDYAWNTLKLIRLEARCHPDNKAAASLLENAGFRMVGRLSSDLLIYGNLSDTLLWELVNPNYAIEPVQERVRGSVDGQPEAEEQQQLDDDADDDVEVGEPDDSGSDYEFARIYGAASSAGANRSGSLDAGAGD